MQALLLNRIPALAVDAMQSSVVQRCTHTPPPTSRTSPHPTLHIVHYAPTTTAFFQFLESIRLVPDSGPLYQLFLSLCCVLPPDRPRRSFSTGRSPLRCHLLRETFPNRQPKPGMHSLFHNLALFWFLFLTHYYVIIPCLFIFFFCFAVFLLQLEYNFHKERDSACLGHYYIASISNISRHTAYIQLLVQ